MASIAEFSVDKKEVSDSPSKVLGYGRWYDAEEGTAWRDLLGFVRALEQRQMPRRMRNLEYAARYMNYELMGTYPQLLNRRQVMRPPGRIALNAIQSCVDTVTNNACADLPRPMLLTDDGDFDQQQRAKRLSAYVEGVIEDTSFDALVQRACQHSGVFGTGLIKVFADADTGKVGAEHVLTDEVMVDDSDGMYVNPRCVYQRRFLHRAALVSRFPDLAAKIRRATSGIPGELVDSAMDDMVRAVEAWCLPSVPGASDGRHVICIEGADLVDEAWKHCWHPFLALRWGERITGYWGFGIAEQLIGIQHEIDKTIRCIQENIEVTAAARMAIEASSRVNANQISNRPGSLITYVGTAPQPLEWQALTQEPYQHLENLWNKAFQIVGVSQLNAQGVKPQGVTSGEAMRTYHDITSARFSVFGKRIERLYVQAAKVIIDLSKDLYDGKDSVRLSNRDGRFVRSVEWNEVDMEADRFQLLVYPVSALPKTPAGRLAAVTDLMQAGVISKEIGQSLLNFPDLAAAQSMDPKVASFDLTMKLLEQMLERGEYEPPTEYMDLNMARTMVQGALIRAKVQGAPDDRLRLLSTFIQDCTDILGGANTANAAPANTNAPMARPSAPPTSPLLPNAPGGAPPPAMAA